MKLAKLSLAAMVVAGLASSSFAADTLADAFAKGKVSGELRAWYWDRDNVDGVNAVATPVKTGFGDESIFNVGVMLNYVTDSFYGLYMGVTVQSNYAPTASAEAKNVFAADEYGSGAVLSEAYLGYKLKNTDVKIGRMFLATPVVGGSGSRMIKEAFEGALVVNTDLPGTTLGAGYVGKMQARTTAATGFSADNYVVLNAYDNGSDIPEFLKRAVLPGATSTTGTGSYAFDGAYTALAINKSIPNLTLTGQYATVKDVGTGTTVLGDADIYNAEANYLLPMSGFKLGLDAMYRTSKTSNAGSQTDLAAFDGGSFMAARVGVKELAGFGLSFAYGQSADDRKLIAGMGNGADITYTGTVIRGGTNTYGADIASYKFEASYDFSTIGVAGLTALAQYAVANQKDGASHVPGVSTGTATELADTTTTHLSVAYAVPALKGLSIALQYETQKKDVDTVAGAAVPTKSYTQDEYRFMANYKF